MRHLLPTVAVLAAALLGAGFASGELAQSGNVRLAFNGRAGRRSAILVQIHGDSPVEATIVLVFKISHPRQGAFGTVFTATIPKIASDLGYVSKMDLTFDRRYRFDGRLRSLLSARCAAPRGFPSVVFSFVRGSFVFANGQRLSVTLPGHCRALPA